MTRTTVNIRVFLVIVSILFSCRNQPETTSFDTAKLMILDNNCSSLVMAISTNRPLIAQVDPWDRSTLLHIACASSPNIEIVGILLKAGAVPNALNDVGRSSLHNAYIFSVSDKLTTPVVDLLLSHGAKRKIKDNYVKTLALP